MSIVSDELKAISDYPDISFIDNYTVARLEEDMVSWFKEKRKELTGEDVVLGMADDRRILLQAGAYYIFQGYMYADNAGKMGLLKYSRGDYLENLGAMKHVPRMEAKRATVTVRFQVVEGRDTTTGIPMGTRMTAGDGIYFATDGYYEILPGELYTDAGATCTVAGSQGNDYDIGDIKVIVDPVPFIDQAWNITKPENGSDLEEDDPSYRERIFLAPASYSTAGTEASYEYFVRQFNPDVSDIWITVPEDCVVRIQYLLNGGKIPEEESIDGLLRYLSEKERKVLCDKIQILPPGQIPYEINLRYYINQSDKNRANLIQNNVEQSINDYVAWQCAKMGRDINPDMLRHKIIAAGAKRAEIISPEFTIITPGTVSKLVNRSVIYGGIEND